MFPAYLDISKHYTHAYSQPCLSLTKHIYNPTYIHNTILNIFTKAPSHFPKTDGSVLHKITYRSIAFLRRL